MSPHLEEITRHNFESAVRIRIRPDQKHAEETRRPLLGRGVRPVGLLMAFLDIDWYGDDSVRRSGELSGEQPVGVRER